MIKITPLMSINTLFVFILFLQIIQLRIITTPFVQWCQEKHILMFSISPAPSSPSYNNQYNHYEDPQSAETRSLVLKCTENQNFKFYNYGLDSQPTTQRQCPLQYTSSLPYYFIKNFLFVIKQQNSKWKFYVCKYNPNSNSVVHQIPIQSLHSSSAEANFVPSIISPQKIGLLKSNYIDSTSQIYTFSYADSGSNAGFTLIQAQSMQDYSIPKVLFHYHGNRNLLYDMNGKKFYKSSQDPLDKNWVQTSQIILNISPQHEFIRFQSLKGQKGIYAFCCNPELIIQLTESGSVSQAFFNDPVGGVSSFQFFSDGVYNFIRVTEKTVDWVYVSSTFNFESISVISLTDSTTHDIHYVESSKNKIAIFYTNGVVKFYEKSVDSILTLIFNQDYSNQIVGSQFSSNQNYLVSFKCYCDQQQYKKLYCFGQTQNCVMINQPGKQYCEGKGYNNLNW